MSEAFLVDGVRTPVGRYGGALSGVRPDDLAAHVVREALTRSRIPADAVDDIVLGAANQSGEDNRNVARMAALLAGLPVTVPGYTVNRLCASGLQAIASAAQAVRCGDAGVVVAGGVESMSRAPSVTARFAVAGAASPEVAETALGWRFVNPRMRELDGGDATLSLGECTEKLARMHGVTRQQADAFAARSQQRAARAWTEGMFDAEVTPVAVDAGWFARDETVRPGTTLDGLSALSPAFTSDGIVTAGNCSPLSDGASAIVVAAEGAIDAHGMRPRARVVGYAVAGVAPSLFGSGPVPAIEKVLAVAGLSLADIDVIEVNEAFAAQVLVCAAMLGLDPERVNPVGGAIALGHPLGSSGSRLVVTMLGQLERTGGRYGIASMCVGVGQGAAMLVERLP